MINDDFDKRVEESRKACEKSHSQTHLAELKMKKLLMQMELKTSDYEEFKNLEARIRELEP